MCPLDTAFGGLWYSQILSPTALAQVGYEFALQSGYLASPYRMDTLPYKRWRNVAAGRAAKYFPDSGTGLQLYYRYYWDAYPAEWQVTSHTIETRVFQALGSELEIRLTGRYYSQGSASVWCDLVSNPSCNQVTTDPKLSAVATEFLEAKVYWEATSFRDVPFLGWFALGTFELSYGRFFQNTSFANAHVLQTGYSMPF